MSDPEAVALRPDLFAFPPVEGETPALLTSHCTDCGRRFFPRRAECPACGPGSLEEAASGNRGTVYASTIVRVPSPAGLKPPYAYGYVDLTPDGPRVFALFTGAEVEAFSPGIEVELVLEAVTSNRDGQPVIGHKFRPVPQDTQETTS